VLVTATPEDVLFDATADPEPLDEDVLVADESPDTWLDDVADEPLEDADVAAAAPCPASAPVNPIMAARLTSKVTNRARSAGCLRTRVVLIRHLLPIDSTEIASPTCGLPGRRL
jgi:hypothetical protein